MDTIVNVLRVLHVVSAILMAWPFYALVAVNQRAKLGPPLGDRVDVLIENLIKNRVLPCYIFQVTVLISGLALIFLHNQGLSALINFPMIGLKFLFLLVIAGVLSYVYFGLQPRIDALFAEGGSPVKQELAPQIAALRLRRKKMASICLFCVLANAMFGMQAWAAFPLWLTGVLLIAIGLFTWRAYSTVTAYGWA